MKDEKSKDFKMIPDDLVSGTDEFIVKKFKTDTIKNETTKDEPGFYEISIPLQMLDPNPNNERENLNVTKESPIYKSIDKYNILNPLIVVKNPESENRYIIIGGNRRLAALRLKYGKDSNTPVLCRVSTKKYGLEDDIKDLIFQIQDNMIRDNLSHRDQYNIISKIKEKISKNSKENITNSKLAFFTNLSEDHVKKILSFDKLSNEDKEYSDQLSWTASVEYARSPKDVKEKIKTLNAKSNVDISTIKKVLAKDINPIKNIAIPRGKKFRLKHNFLKCDVHIYKEDISLEDAIKIITGELKKDKQGLWKKII